MRRRARTFHTKNVSHSYVKTAINTIESKGEYAKINIIYSSGSSNIAIFEQLKVQLHINMMCARVNNLHQEPCRKHVYTCREDDVPQFQTANDKSEKINFTTSNQKSKKTHRPFISEYICPGTLCFAGSSNLKSIPGSGPGTEN